MYTRFITLSLIALSWNLLTACSSQGGYQISNQRGKSTVLAQSRCQETRAALDIGSGTTKFKVATVDHCKREILKTLFKKEVALPLKANIRNGQLPLPYLQKASQKIIELSENSVRYGVPLSQISAVATEALREAKNAIVLVKNLEAKGLRLRPITQAEEARLGHLSAVIGTGLDPQEVTSFDIGGGSFQLVSLGLKPAMLGGHLASVSFKDYVTEHLQKKVRGRSPNPIAPQTALEAISYAEKYARELKDRHPGFQFQKYVIGVGGVFGYSLASQLHTQTLTSQDLEKAYPRLIKRTAQEIKGPYQDTESTNLLLTLGLLKGLGLENRKILIKQANLTDGLLIDGFLTNRLHENPTRQFESSP